MNPVQTKTTLTIDGMHCGSCVAAVSSALRRLPSVHVERAAVGEVTLVRDPRAAPYATLVTAVAQAGYRVLAGNDAVPAAAEARRP